MEAAGVEKKRPKVRIIRMRYVPAIDATGLYVIQEELHSLRKKGGAFLISDIHTQPLFALERSGLLQETGEENIFEKIDDALNRARVILNLPQMERSAPFVPTVKREMKKNGQES